MAVMGLLHFPGDDDDERAQTFLERLRMNSDE